jgi:hypothetical protein
MVVKGSLAAVEGGEDITVKFHFNPKEYTISKSNTWNANGSNQGSDVPPLTFGGGQPKQLKLQLLFDTYVKIGNQSGGTDVREEYTNKLFKMMEINPKLPEGGTNQTNGAPPKLKLTWGETWSFFCYLESLSVQFTLFLDSGTPVRATADLGLKQAIDEKQQSGTNPTSGGLGGEHLWQVQPQDRLDLIAHTEYGDSRLWRVIADANKISDPLSIRPGQRLIIPPPGR